MEELLANYIRHLKVERNLSPFTLRNYERDLTEFLRFVQGEGNGSLATVDQRTVRRYLGWLLEQGRVKASLARKLSAIRSFYRYLVAENLISSAPLPVARGRRGTSALPKLEKRLPSFLVAEEMDKLLSAPDTTTPQGQRDQAILELIYAAGLRVSEVVNLDLSHLDLEGRQVRVWGKGSKERMVLMGRPAARALELYLSQGRRQLLGRSKNNALFLNRYGKRLAERRVQHLVSGYAKQAGIDKRVHPHLLRHTFATHLLDGGADLRVVQELLGHTSLASTQVYTHVARSQARRVYLEAHPLAQPREADREEP